MRFSVKILMVYEFPMGNYECHLKHISFRRINEFNFKDESLFYFLDHTSPIKILHIFFIMYIFTYLMYSYININIYNHIKTQNFKYKYFIFYKLKIYISIF